jgi:hypothetical protein
MVTASEDITVKQLGHLRIGNVDSGVFFGNNTIEKEYMICLEASSISY